MAGEHQRMADAHTDAAFAELDYFVGVIALERVPRERRKTLGFIGRGNPQEFDRPLQQLIGWILDSRH
jgi:hypothetical protein